MLGIFEDLAGVDLAGLGTDAQKNRILDVRQVVARLGVSPPEVRSWASQELLPGRKVGTAFAFKAVDLWQWVMDGLVDLRMAEAAAEKGAGDPDCKRFVQAFGKQGAVWWEQGVPFSEAKKLYQAQHQAELEDLCSEHGEERGRLLFHSRRKWPKRKRKPGIASRA